MRRREFITLASSAIPWPLVARAQQSGQVRRVSVLMVMEEGDPLGKSYLAAFQDGLQKLGWNDGNARLDIRWGGGQAERLRASAIELIDSKPDVVVAGATAALVPLKQATQTIPIVFAQVSDPVRGGFVPSLTSRRQHHRLCSLRVCNRGEMAGIAQAACAGGQSHRRFV